MDSDFYQAIEYAKRNYDNCQHSIQSLTAYLERLHFPSIMPKNDTLLYNLLLTDINPTKETLIKYRAIGLPTATDFSPIRRHQDEITYWIYYQDPRIYNSNIYMIANLWTGKIYRQTFTPNPIPQTNEYIPSFFRNPFQKDVTDLYLSTIDIQINIPTTVLETYAYLAVYNDQYWQLIAFSLIKEGKCNFTKLGRNCIYLPVHYPNKKMQALASPFILHKDGKIYSLQINKDSLQTIRINSMDSLRAQPLFDADPLSMCIIQKWVGMDFGKPVALSQIRYLPRNDANSIYPDNDYELFYFDFPQGWVSLGIKTATGYSIEYDQVPTNGLYWLRNRTRGQEERIFTWENRKAHFW